MNNWCCFGNFAARISRNFHWVYNDARRNLGAHTTQHRDWLHGGIKTQE